MTWDTITSMHTVVFGIEIGYVPILVMAAVVFLSTIFTIFYIGRASLYIFKTWGLPKQIAALRKDEATPVIGEDIAALLKRPRRLQDSWREYQETLHEQWQIASGERRLAHVRATMPAETFFSTQVLVDTPLGTEFFKHLPGILTGIGIIGTFIGLITGLQNFNLNLDPKLLQVGLGNLMMAVKEAFVASGVAIAAAILITLAEKILLTWCYKRTEAIAQAIDTLYEAGAGEEYLARLVTSSEESAVQTRHLKDALVEDLRTLLTELTDRQIEASRQYGDTVAGSIGNAIRDGLQEPMAQLAGVIQTNVNQNGDAVHGMLENVLTAFMAKLDDSIGGQMKGLHGMMTESVGALRDMQGGFQQLLGQMVEAGGATSRAMSEEFARMMADAEQRQRQMNETLLLAVQQMREQMTGGQADMQAQTARSLETLRTTLQEMMEEIRRQREAGSDAARQDMAAVKDSLTSLVAEMKASSREVGETQAEQMRRMMDEAEQRQRQMAETMAEAQARIQDAMKQAQAETGGQVQTTLAAMAEQLNGFLANTAAHEQDHRQRSEQQQQAVTERTVEMLSAMDQHLKELAAASADSVAGIKQAVASLGETTSRAIDGMNRGAERMGTAADSFTAAGQQVERTIDRTGTLLDRAVAASSSLDASVRAVESVVGSYNQTRNTMETLAETLRHLVAEAENRAGAGREVVEAMRRVVADFQAVQEQTSGYLTNINGVLATSFKAFKDGIESSIGHSRGEFDKALSEAVQMISGQLQDLDAILNNFSMRQKRVS